jgi:regulator of nucleoside diphosphate kinase
MRNRSIIVSSTDRARLLQLIGTARLDPHVPSHSLDVLDGELARAAIVKPSDLPHDVVAMNSTVWFRDLESEEIERYTLVFPSDADVIRDRISVLAPIGTALLGYRLGDIVEWRVPRGHCQLEIIKVAQHGEVYEHEPAAAFA